MSDLRKAALEALEAMENLYITLPPESVLAVSLHRRITALIEALAKEEQEPVLVVEQEPDYMSRGHYYKGSKSHIDPTKVWKLPIGTKLYTAPPQRPAEPEQEN